MAYTTINKHTDYFNTVLYTGNGSTQSITGVGFKPDWTWIKCRSHTENHMLTDVVRGTNKNLRSNQTNAEETSSNNITSFDSDGFGLGNGGGVNENTRTFASWSWLAAGTAPSKTYTVKVVSDSGNKYRFDDFGTSAVTLELSEGGTYTFDQSDSSNSGHPLRFSTTSDGSHGGGSEYTTGVTTNGTPGSAGAYTRITVASSAPTLYYYCTAHSGTGGQANTPTTNSFSNFDGSIQSNISPNTTAGFSIVSYTGNGTSGATIGHGLGSVPKMMIVKCLTGESWQVYHVATGNGKTAELNINNAPFSVTNRWNSTDPTSSVFTLGNSTTVNANGTAYIAYIFAPKKGFSKFGSYTGNGNSDGPFIYTGFKPAFVMVKRTDGAGDWAMMDNKRPNQFNVVQNYLKAQVNDAEQTDDSFNIDILSNGWKARYNNSNYNGSGGSYLYMAFAAAPLVGTNNIPGTAR